MGAEPRTSPMQQQAVAVARAEPAWPAGCLLSGSEAESAVRAVLAGVPGALDPRLVTRIDAAVTELERASFDGADDPSTADVRAASALRWQLSTALLDAPANGAVDDAALSSLLAEADAVLARLATAADGAPAPFAQSASAIRRALVSDAIALQQVAQRLGPAASAQHQAEPQRPSSRVLSVVSEADSEAPSRRPRALWILLAVSMVIAAAWHGSVLLKGPAPLPQLDGAPAGLAQLPERNGRREVATRDGRAMSGPDLERFRAAQQAKGKRVVDVAPGVYAIENAR